MSRRWLVAGCLLWGSIAAYFGSLVPPRPSVSLRGVPGLASYRPICEYVSPDVAANVWIRMYSAKQRARSPEFTSFPATEQPGVSIGDGVTLAPDARSFVISSVWAALAAATSPAIAVGVMSPLP